MPTYEYECRECRHRFEYFQMMTDDALEECPRCGGELRRLIGSGSGIIFKGRGFHATDYGRSSAAYGAVPGSSVNAKNKESRT
jgi:putative FmdB family regulatory protein